MNRRPVVFDTDPDTAPPPSPADAPPVPEPDFAPEPEGRAMQQVTALAARRGSWFGRLVWAAVTGLVAMAISVAAWDFVTGLVARNVVLGWVAMALAGLVLLGVLVLVLRELSAMTRLSRIDKLQALARAAAADHDRPAALDIAKRLDTLYADRDALSWQRAELARQRDEVLDADALLALAERQLMAPLDTLARTEVQAAARAVATATAIIPLALADVVVALTANIRMVRRIAEIYGGRAGTFGSWRLLRAVASHLLATGAVAVGDDLVGSIAGGGALAKVSRRFGEGVINGALTARVGIAAMEVCRPLPYLALERPRVTGMVKSALAGMFTTGK